MGIRNIHILIDPDETPNRRSMSRHVVVNKQATRKWVFGWDQPLQSFYLQVHDLTLPEDERIVVWLGADKDTIISEDERIVVWLGADKDTIMYEVEDLNRAAMENGLGLDHTYRTALYREKDEGI
jgi:hypothetical protein